MSVEEQKTAVPSVQKTSMEILSELFSSFDAEPPVIVKKEKTGEQKKHKKKKKHKNKDKKHKKKSKKRKRSHSCSSDSSAVDLTEILIKQENDPGEEQVKTDLIQEIVEVPDKIETGEDAVEKKTKETDDNKKGEIIIKDLKFSSIFDATIQAIKEKEKIKKTIKDDALHSSETDQKDKEEKPKHKHKHHHHQKKKPKRSRSVSPEHKKSKSRSKSRSPGRNGYHRCDKHKQRDEKKDYVRSQYDDFRKHIEADYRSRSRDRFREKDFGHDDRYRWKSRDPFYKQDSSSDRDDKWRDR